MSVVNESHPRSACQYHSGSPISCNPMKKNTTLVIRCDPLTTLSFWTKDYPQSFGMTPSAWMSELLGASGRSHAQNKGLESSFKERKDMGLQHPAWAGLPAQDNPNHQGEHRKFWNWCFQRPEFKQDQIQDWSALPRWDWKALQKANSPYPHP